MAVRPPGRCLEPSATNSELGLAILIDRDNVIDSYEWMSPSNKTVSSCQRGSVKFFQATLLMLIVRSPLNNCYPTQYITLTITLIKASGVLELLLPRRVASTGAANFWNSLKTLKGVQGIQRTCILHFR